MNRRLYGRFLFYTVTITGLCTVGIAILASFMSHPGSAIHESWHVSMIALLTFFAVMGGLALRLRGALGLPWWLGASLIAYPVITFLTLSPEMRRYLVDSDMRARLAYADVGRFTGLDAFILMLLFAGVLASFFFSDGLGPTDPAP